MSSPFDDENDIDNKTLFYTIVQLAYLIISVTDASNASSAPNASNPGLEVYKSSLLLTLNFYCLKDVLFDEAFITKIARETDSELKLLNSGSLKIFTYFLITAFAFKDHVACKDLLKKLIDNKEKTKELFALSLTPEALEDEQGEKSGQLESNDEEVQNFFKRLTQERAGHAGHHVGHVGHIGHHMGHQAGHQAGHHAGQVIQTNERPAEKQQNKQIDEEIERQRQRNLAIEEKQRLSAEEEGRKLEELRLLREQEAFEQGQALQASQASQASQEKRMTSDAIQESNQQKEPKQEEQTSAINSVKNETFEQDVSFADPFLLAKDALFVSDKELNMYRSNEKKLLLNILQEPLMKKKLVGLLEKQKNEMNSLVKKYITSGRPVSYDRLYQIEQEIANFAEYFASQVKEMNIKSLNESIDSLTQSLTQDQEKKLMSRSRSLSALRPRVVPEDDSTDESLSESSDSEASDSDEEQ